MLERLKQKWEIDNNWDFTKILLVFSLAGLGVTVSRRAIFTVLGLSHAALWERILASLILIVPLYQLSTLFFGFFFGQFNFFWKRQVEIGRALKRFFLKKYRA